MSHNRPMDDINPLDVAGVYVYVINKSKTMKWLCYLWFGDILLMGRPKYEHHFGVIDHGIQVTGGRMTLLCHFCMA